MEFDRIDLKPLSWQILDFIHGKEPMKAEDIAAQLNLGTRQVDAAITKSLVRWGFVIREAKLTRLRKKEYNLIKLTDKGERYVRFRRSQEG